MRSAAWRLAGAAILSFATLVGCKDVGRFSTTDNHYEGIVVGESFVRLGIAEGTRACLLLDGEHLQDAPGSVTTSDGRFTKTPLRPIPQIYNDPLSTLDFGEGRVETHVYAAFAAAGDGGAAGGDAMLFVSLMKSGNVELRVVRGAPGLPPATPAAASDAGGDGGAATASDEPLFAVFPLTKKHEGCPF